MAFSHGSVTICSAVRLTVFFGQDHGNSSRDSSTHGTTKNKAWTTCVYYKWDESQGWLSLRQSNWDCPATKCSQNIFGDRESGGPKGKQAKPQKGNKPPALTGLNEAWALCYNTAQRLGNFQVIISGAILNIRAEAISKDFCKLRIKSPKNYILLPWTSSNKLL